MVTAFPVALAMFPANRKRMTPEGNSQLLRLVFPCFFDVIQARLLAEQLVHFDRRRASGSSGGQHEWVKDRDSEIDCPATKFFSKNVRLSASLSAT